MKGLCERKVHCCFCFLRSFLSYSPFNFSSSASIRFSFNFFDQTNLSLVPRPFVPFSTQKQATKQISVRPVRCWERRPTQRSKKNALPIHQILLGFFSLVADKARARPSTKKKRRREDVCEMRVESDFLLATHTLRILGYFFSLFSVTTFFLVAIWCSLLVLSMLSLPFSYFGLEIVIVILAALHPNRIQRRKKSSPKFISNVHTANLRPYTPRLPKHSATQFKIQQQNETHHIIRHPSSCRFFLLAHYTRTMVD